MRALLAHITRLLLRVSRIDPADLYLPFKWTLFILPLLLVNPAFADQSDSDRSLETCAAWNKNTQNEKLAFVHGWLRGVEAADQITREEALSQLWPPRQRVGGVVIELDGLCRRDEYRNAEIQELIRSISGKR
jgi:hypothetical protein